jgi:hypothetical protein
MIKEPMAKLPHIYRELVSELTQTAKKHCGTGSMREALSYVLSLRRAGSLEEMNKGQKPLLLIPWK